MANRVTATEVKEIISTSLEDLALAAFITAANLTVTEKLTSNDVLSDDQLKEIERWLSAHFLAMSNKDLQARDANEEENLDASIKYAGKTGLNLDATRFGQVAKAIDASGILAEIGQTGVLIQAVTSFDYT